MARGAAIRILHVETGRHLYGGVDQVLRLVAGLSAAGLDGALVCAAGSLTAVAGEAHGIDVVPVAMSGDLDPRFAGRLWRQIRERQPDLVHIHSRRGADRFGGIAATLASVPAVLTRRVDRPESIWGRPKYRPYRRIVAISGCIRDQLLQTGVPARRLRLVHSGVAAPAVELAWPRERFLREFGLAADDFVIGVVAQLIPRKGHRYLLDALPRILAAYGGTRVLCFGVGPLEERLRAAVADRDLGDAVRFAGFRDDLRAYIGHLQLVVHPALREGLGVSLLEAQAAGVPVAAFRAGGVPEAVVDGETGLLVPPGDAEALAEAVIYLAWHPRERMAMGDAARHHVAQRFSVDTMVRGNLDVYREILRNVEETREVL